MLTERHKAVEHTLKISLNIIGKALNICVCILWTVCCQSNNNALHLSRSLSLILYSIISFFELQYGQRVPTAASPSNTNSSSSSNTGSQSGTLSTSLSNTTNTNTTMGPNGTAQNQNQQGGEQLSKTNLYIRGLQQGTTDKDLINMCAQWVSSIQLQLYIYILHKDVGT